MAKKKERGIQWCIYKRKRANKKAENDEKSRKEKRAILYIYIWRLLGPGHKYNMSTVRVLPYQKLPVKKKTHFFLCRSFGWPIGVEEQLDG